LLHRLLLQPPYSKRPRNPHLYKPVLPPQRKLLPRKQLLRLLRLHPHRLLPLRLLHLPLKPHLSLLPYLHLSNPPPRFSNLPLLPFLRLSYPPPRFSNLSLLLHLLSPPPQLSKLLPLPFLRLINPWPLHNLRLQLQPPFSLLVLLILLPLDLTLLPPPLHLLFPDRPPHPLPP